MQDEKQQILLKQSLSCKSDIIEHLRHRFSLMPFDNSLIISKYNDQFLSSHV